MRKPLLVAALVLLTLAACAGGGDGQPLGSGPAVPSLGPPAASSTPRTIVLPTPGPTPAGSLSAPPVARIATGVTSAVDGVLGGWTLDGRTHDQAWIDLALLKRTGWPAGELVFAGWADGTPIEAWSARISTVGDTTGADAVAAGSGAANGADFVTIGRIVAGTWILELTLLRADGRGEATYYWEIRPER
jgi:hypothetical protein